MTTRAALIIEPDRTIEQQEECISYNGENHLSGRKERFRAFFGGINRQA